MFLNGYLFISGAGYQLYDTMSDCMDAYFRMILGGSDSQFNIIKLINGIAVKKYDDFNIETGRLRTETGETKYIDIDEEIFDLLNKNKSETKRHVVTKRINKIVPPRTEQAPQQEEVVKKVIKSVPKPRENVEVADKDVILKSGPREKWIPFTENQVQQSVVNIEETKDPKNYTTDMFEQDYKSFLGMMTDIVAGKLHEDSVNPEFKLKFLIFNMFHSEDNEAKPEFEKVKDLLIEMLNEYDDPVKNEGDHAVLFEDDLFLSRKQNT